MSNEKHESYAVLYKYLQNAPKTSAELYEFIYSLTGERVVFKNVCPEHESPWEYIWHSYRIDLPQWKDKTPRNIVGLGPRGGQKTLSEAKLIAAELLLKPGSHSISMAAIREQAQRGYGYVVRYLKHPLLFELDLIEKMLMKETILRNGSKFHQVTATLNSTNGSHVPKLRIDEVDLIDPEILQESLMQANSMNGWTAQVAYTSTRKVGDGTMDALIKKAEKRKEYKIITWCWKETSEPCPEWRRGKKEEVYEIEDIFNPGESVVVQAYEGCKECPLLKACRGDLARSNGNVPIDDSINEFLTLDTESWIAQKECREPKRSNLFFAEWHSKFNTMDDIPYNPTMPVDLSFDFSNGGDSPTVMQVWQESAEGDNFLLASQEWKYKSSNVVAEEMLALLNDLGVKSARIQVGDSAQMQEIRNLNSYNSFFRIMPTKKITRKEGWPVCRRTIKDNTGRRRLFVSQKRANKFIWEIERAIRRRSDPDDIAPACSDHHLDSWRYREVRVHHFGAGEPNVRLLEPPPDLVKDGYIINRESTNRIKSIWEIIDEMDDND